MRAQESALTERNWTKLA